MLCSLLFKNSTTLEDYKCALKKKILLSVIVICHTKKLLSDETKLLNKWEQFKQDH